jgi:hypothetical protein
VRDPLADYRPNPRCFLDIPVHLLQKGLWLSFRPYASPLMVAVDIVEEYESW